MPWLLELVMRSMSRSLLSQNCLPECLICVCVCVCAYVCVCYRLSTDSYIPMFFRIFLYFLNPPIFPIFSYNLDNLLIFYFQKMPLVSICRTVMFFFSASRYFYLQFTLCASLHPPPPPPLWSGGGHSFTLCHKYVRVSVHLSVRLYSTVRVSAAFKVMVWNVHHSKDIHLACA